jgi:uncharacterized protein YqhQ
MASDAPPKLGGMALQNGLLVHGPRHWAAAVRDEGEVIVASGPKPRFAVGPLGSIPLLRGVLRLGEAFALLPAVRRGLPQARFAMEDGLSNATIVGVVVVAAIARRRVRSVLIQETIAAVAGLAPALIALRGSQAAVWHAVEHKSIAAYEHGGAAELANAAEHAKEHQRCGSNLVLPLVVSSAVANTAVRLATGRRTVATRLLAAGLSVGVAVEVFAFAGRSPEHPVSRVVHRVGHVIQAGFVTREPGADDLAVGRTAMETLLQAEGAD